MPPAEQSAPKAPEAPVGQSGQHPTGESENPEYKKNISREIHITNKKTKGKLVTLVEGLNPQYNFEKIARAMRTEICCAASVQKPDASAPKGTSPAIVVQGLYAPEVMQWLLKVRLVKSPAQFQVHNIMRK